MRNGTICLMLGWAVVFLSSPSFGEIHFEKTILSPEFRSEGCAVGDFNRDGKKDVLAGSYWYENPTWTPHKFREAGKFQFDKGYSDSFINGAFDVNGDGWDDAIVIGMPGEQGYWYENPQGREGDWKRYEISPSVCNESPNIVDVDKDGRTDLIFPSSTDKRWAWFSPPGTGGTAFTRHVISASTAIGTHRFAHGMGVGDLNLDGHNDIIYREGWWESPDDPTKPNWIFHPADLGPECAHMHAYDFDGDGDMDVVSSSAHKYGIWWHEQTKDEEGRVVWIHHEIDKSFSQTHALCFVDMNGDGFPDLITGKRFYAHNGHDPGAHDPAVLVWYEYRLENGNPTWTRHPIDNDSGVGTNFSVEDISGDGKPDIAVSNKKGTFIFIQKTQ